MPKQNEKSEVKQDIPLEEIYKGENSPEIKITPEDFQAILQYFSTSGEFETIALECEKDGLQVITHNITNNITGKCKALSDDMEIINTGYFIFDVKDTLEKVTRKHKESEVLNIAWPSGGKIRITDGNGKHPINITPKTLNSILQSKSNRAGLQFKDRLVQFNKKDGLQTVKVDGVSVKIPANTRFEIDQDELLRGLIDAKNADSNNIIYHFSKEKNWCVAGTWNKKGDDSQTDDLEIDEFQGEEFHDAIPTSGIEIIKVLSGTVNVQANTTTYTDDGQILIPGTIIFSQWTDLGEIHYGIRVDKKADD